MEGGNKLVIHPPIVPPPPSTIENRENPRFYLGMESMHFLTIERENEEMMRLLCY